MANREEIKNLVNVMASTVEQSGSMAGVGEGAGQAAKVELAMFMMYLSASDGEIKWQEASFISDVCDLNLTPQSLSNFIREKNIYSTEFEQKVPTTLQLMIAVDNALLQQLGDDVPDASSIIISTYRSIGEQFINSDNDIDYNEKNDLDIYINMMEEYANNNSDRRKNSVFGFVKESSSVSAPTKSGVSAPKKG